MHYGQAKDILQQRQQVLDQAYQQHPERFVGGVPQVAQLPSAVWINPPKEKKAAAVAAFKNGEVVGQPEQREGLSTNPQLPPNILPEFGYQTPLLDINFQKKVSQTIDTFRFEGFPLKFEPGAQFGYSNVGYSMLAKVIEEVSETSFDDYLQTNIFTPTRMNQTTADWDSSVPGSCDRIREGGR